MSGNGAPNLFTQSSGVRLAIVASTWHQPIMDALVAAAETEAARSEATFKTFRVPGAFELPLACQAVVDAGYDAVVALGVVIRGETPHFDYVCQAATDGIFQVSLASGVPIGFGLLTVDNEKQALDRAGLPQSRENKGLEATQAALSMLQLLRSLEQ